MNFSKVSKLKTIVTLSGAVLLSAITGNTALAAENIKLEKNTDAYINAYDAKKEVNKVREYEAGDYYVYKEFNGMYNISKVKNSPGAWVNPNNIKKEESNKGDSENSKEESVESNRIKLDKSTSVYINAYDAINKRNSLKTYSAGNYYIYKQFNGMYNISKTKGLPGAWINPNDKENPANSSQNQEKDNNSKPESYQKTINMRASHYTPDPAANGGWTVTATGKSLRSGVNKYIAVDPKVIPLGSLVYIEGYGYRTAEDVGGAIKGNKIDILVGSKSEAYRLGVKNVVVHVIREGR